MRKSFSLFSTLFILISVNSQVWFDIGFKGGLGPGILMNQNIWDDADYNHRLKASTSFGAKLGLNFNNNHQITFDVMINNFQQDFLHNELDSATMSSPLYKSNISFKSIDYMLLYRHNKDGRYLEFGPSVQKISSVSREDEFPTSILFDLQDVNQIQTNMVFGFGAYFIGSENFGVTTGVRIAYSLTDLISETGLSNLHPTLKQYPEYKATHPLFICFIMEFNFDFAFIAKANCSRRKLILF